MKQGTRAVLPSQPGAALQMVCRAWTATCQAAPKPNALLGPLSLSHVPFVVTACAETCWHCQHKRGTGKHPKPGEVLSVLVHRVPAQWKMSLLPVSPARGASRGVTMVEQGPKRDAEQGPCDMPRLPAQELWSICSQHCLLWAK